MATRSCFSFIILALGCRAPQPSVAREAVASHDPTKGEVILEHHGAWDACLLLDLGEVGIWRVAVLPVWETYGCPEVVGLDDRGRCHVLVSYSGKWTPRTAVDDATWLAALAHGDVDPRIEGTELYVGGKAGNVYQVKAWKEGVLDCRRIAHLSGCEVHTLVAAGSPRTAGTLYAFTRPGALFALEPSEPGGLFRARQLGELPGRVRDAVVLPSEREGTLKLATVSRAGFLRIITLENGVASSETVLRMPMGLGRIAQQQVSGHTVLYVAADDGRILRLQEDGPHAWSEEVIHRCSPGPRGIAAGRFTPNEGDESVAVFGYSRRVELLTRTTSGWSTEVLFVDRDKGHWLASGEVDGRNETQELFLSGYGGRIVMLRRAPSHD